MIEEEAIKLVDEKGDCKQEIVDLLHIIKEHPGVVLATGPVSYTHLATIITPNTRPQMATVRPGVMAKAERKKGAKRCV